MKNAIILLSCPDQKGIVAKISQFIFEHSGNIEHADQHIDAQSGTLFMRIEWSLGAFTILKEKIADSFRPLAQEFNMNWDLYFTDKIPRVALVVSKYLHCLYDVLLRYKEGQFKCEIPLVISNHPDAAKVAQYFGIDFYELPVSIENKGDQEKRQLALLKEKEIELVVLVRYMQILPPQFIASFPNKIINIHHSFLPAFVGKQPYYQAYQKGVKIIGATSHYVTEELDSGPIIEQDTVRISHRDSLEDLVRKGQDLEKMVLSRAIKWHLERKILVYNNKTVIFD